jgi:hypothetical protein
MGPSSSAVEGDEVTSTSISAGAAMVDITPDMGIQIDGDIGRRRPVEEIRDPLYARALVLESGSATCCVLSLDLCSVSKHSTRLIRQKASQQFGIAPEAIMIHAVQNHAAPSIGSDMVSDDYTDLPSDLWFIRGGDERYHGPAVEGILSAIGEACKALQPVQVKAGRGVDGRVAFNRRFVMRDGSVRTHPPVCDPNILYCEGPTDPEVGVVTLAGESGVVAVLLHHTCHPVHGYPEGWISAGWPGAWAKLVGEHWGPGCVCLVLNGACGNICHGSHLDPTQRDDYAEIGRVLTETVVRALPELKHVAPATLRWGSHSLSIPRRKLDAQELASAQALLARHPEPIWLDDAKTAIDWDWVYAVTLMDLASTRERESQYDYEVQVIRLGEIAIIALEGEPFVEAQLAIKQRSPAPYTFPAHNSNGYAGYLPTRAALELGGYETRTATWSQLAPEALEMVQDGALGLLAEVFR